MNSQNLKPFVVFPPGEILSEELESRNISQSDFAEILGRPLKTVNEIIKGKKSITPESANDIAAALGTSPEFWLGLQSEYDLYKISKDNKNNRDDVRSRAELYANFPIKEMRKRGYISNNSDISIVKEEVFALFDIRDICQWSEACLASFRKSKCGDINNNYVNTWIELGRKIASEIKVADFNKEGLKNFASNIKNYSTKDNGVIEIVKELKELGVRLIFLPHFSKTRVDGAVFWIDKNPVILMSLRYDRIDNFYFTLVHEIGHIVLHGDDDNNNFFDDTNSIDNSGNEKEKEANKFAQENLVSPELINELKKIKLLRSSMVVKKSKEVNIHPGIMIGILQHKKLLSYGQYRVALEKIKDKIPGSMICR